MALKDALKTPPPARTGFRSKIDVWRDALDPSDRAAWDAAVRNPEWTTAALTNVVNAEGGLKVSDAALRDWRKRTLREAA